MFLVFAKKRVVCLLRHLFRSLTPSFAPFGAFHAQISGMEKLLTLDKTAVRRILFFLEFNELSRLYRTGYEKLAELLDISMPEKVVLQSESRFMYGTWPNSLSQCNGLIGLELRTVSSLVESPETTQQGILALPATLRHLILDTPEAELMLQEHDDAKLEVLHKRYMTKATHADPLKHPKLVNLASAFPELTTLVVRGGHVFSSHDLCVLPPKLETLDFGLNDLIDDEVFYYIPSTVKHLQLGAGVRLLREPIRPGEATFFPPELESFWWYRRTPPVGDSPDLSKEQIEAIPRTLKTLHYEGLPLTAIPASMFGSLPPSLTEFEMAYSRTSLNSSDLIAIPPLLTRIELWNITKSWKSISVLLPMTLTDLKVSLIDKYHINEFFEFGLPKMLKKLEITTTEGRLPNLEKLVLPPLLTSFCHHGTRNTGTTLEGHWPDSLTELRVPGPSSGNSMALTLPSTLRTVSVFEMIDADVPKLPSRLETLIVEDL